MAAREAAPVSMLSHPASDDYAERKSKNAQPHGAPTFSRNGAIHSARASSDSISELLDQREEMPGFVMVRGLARLQGDEEHREIQFQASQNR